jgi:hypothetical protein
VADPVLERIAPDEEEAEDQHQPEKRERRSDPLTDGELPFFCPSHSELARFFVSVVAMRK